MKAIFISNPEESKIEDIQYWVDKMFNISKELLELHNKNKNLSRKKKVPKKSDLKIFEYAPSTILNNQDLMIKSMEDSWIYYAELPLALKEDKSFVLKYLKESKHAYYFVLSKEMLSDEEIFSLCIAKDAETYKCIYYHWSLYPKNTEPLKVLELLELNSKIFEHLPPTLKSNLEIAKKAVILDLKNAQYVPKKTSGRIFNNKELNNSLLDLNIEYFIKINNKFRDDEEFMLPLIKKKSSLIEFVSPRLKNKREFLLHAAGAYNLLENISDEFKKDAELMTIHLNSCIYSRHEIQNFQDTHPLIFEIIKKSHHNYNALPEDLKTDEDFIYALLYHNTFYKKPEKSYDPYKKTNIIKLLPESTQLELLKECQGIHPNQNLLFLGEEERLDILLNYARNKYNNIYLQKNLSTKEDVKKLKL